MERLQAAMAGFLTAHITTEARVAAVRTALESQAGAFLREQMGGWVIEILPAESIVPEIYAAWRPLVRDAMLFMVSCLSAPRLAPKLVEQIELPADTPAGKRLLRLISKVPGLQKIGQVLARNRHLSPALRRALSELENGISDVAAAEVHNLVRRLLGERLERHAVEIEPGIFSEASVSAVLRFSWHNPASGGRDRGVFKILKPYVSGCFAEDLQLLQQLAAFLAERHPEYGSALPETLLEVRRLLEHEVDFRREQATLAEAVRAYRGVKRVRIPRVIPALCSDTVTAMSEEDGQKVTSALARAPEAERRQAAEDLIEALVAVPLFAEGERGIFHADPHAGNLLFNRQTGELTLLDWALTERLGSQQRRHAAMLGLMLALRDPAGVCSEIEALRSDHQRPAARFIRDEVEHFIAQFPLAHFPGSMDVMRLLDRLALAGVKFPPALMMFRKVLFTLDGILHDIAAPNVHMDLIAARYLLSRWGNHISTVGSPLSIVDWIAVHCSALLYGGRLWVQWAESVLQRKTIETRASA